MSLAERLNRTDPGLAAPDNAADRRRVIELLTELAGSNLGQRTSAQLQPVVLQAVSSVLANRDRPLTDGERAQLVQQVLDDVLGSGPLEGLLRDPEVSEIMVARFDRIFVERRGRLQSTSLSFTDEEQLRASIDRIVGRVGRRIDESSPMVDARLSDGSRINAVVPPIALDGANLTIRKFASVPLSTRDLLESGTLTESTLDLLTDAVMRRKNIVISGATGAGKSTLLNVLGGLIPYDERIITIEDAAELQLQNPHVVRLEARPVNGEGAGLVTIRQLVRNALRMRPDRIVVGEVRDGAALDMLQAMNTGHDGSLTTVHANSATDALARLETMCLMAGLELPLSAIREQLARAIDLVVHITRRPDGARIVTEVVRVNGVASGEILIEPVLVLKEFEE